MLLIVAYVPFRMYGQELVVSGNGQLRAIPSTYEIGLVHYYNFLPQYKPLTKSVTIKRYDLRSDYGELKRVRDWDGFVGQYDDKHSTIVIMFDMQGNVVEITEKSFDIDKSTKTSIQYSNGKIVEIQTDSQYGFKYYYNTQGRLERAIHGHDFGQWTYKYNLDKNGNIIGVKHYFNTEGRENENMKTFQYDANHRMIGFRDTGYGTKDIQWNYNKEGNLVSYIEINQYSFSKKKEKYEYKFERNADGNPTRCIKYIHGDITIIDCGYEYSYEYTFYPDPKEQERKEALRKKEQKKRDSIQLVNQRRSDSLRLVTQRKNDSINLENQRKEALRQKRNKELFQVCKFLFDSNEEYELCVVKKNELVERDIKGRVVKKLQSAYSIILSGKELRKEKQPGRNELIQICNMCAQLNNVKSQCDNEEIEIISHICDYTESKLGDFVSGRSALNKAYKKTTNKSYSSFLLSYMNDK